MEMTARHEKLSSNLSRIQNADSGDEIAFALGKSELINPVSNFAASGFQQLQKLLPIGIDTIKLANILYVPSRVGLNFERFGIQEGGKRWQVVDSTHDAEIDLE
jgi:hypothetical protein